MGLYALKQFGERILTTLGLYAPFKSSVLYEGYLRVVRRDILRERAREIDFYTQLLGPVPSDAVVFDVGANIGDKAEVFRRVAPKVLCLEPDVSSARFLRQRFGQSKGVVVIDNAVSDRVGSVRFLSFEARSALNTVSPKWADVLRAEKNPRFGHAQKQPRSYEVTSVTLDRLVRDYGPPLYVKIDVEGHEASVLRGLTRMVPLLSFEVNLPQFRVEALECVDHLTALHSRARFNVVIGARATRFEFDAWMSAPEFSDWLARTEHASFDVFVENRMDAAERESRVPTALAS